MSIRVQVFQHVPFEGLGSLESVFTAAQVRIAYTRWSQGEPSPPLQSFDLLVIMGGPMGVYDEEQHPWLKEEKLALKRALDAGKPVLGICLGAQLLAEVLGGAVTRNPHREIGWFPVERVSTIPASWVSGCFPERFTTFHWHGDTFAIPPGAAHLFSSEGCSHQGFCWKDRAVGLQFHPEITPEAITSWLENGAEDLQPGPYVQSPDQIRGRPGDFTANNGWMEKLCRELIGLA
jgi:GMP synthase-like glutamine amidotransferase